jgi:hypothetical protein
MNTKLVEKLTNEYETSYKMWTKNRDWILTPDWFYQFLEMTEEEYQKTLEHYKEIGAIPPTVFKNHLYKQLHISEKTEFIKKGTYAFIDEDTGEYVNSSYIKDGRYLFYLRFIKEHYCPCESCQEKLHELITKSSKLILGNKDYDPPVELSRDWDIDDNSWKELERRKPTLEEFKKLQNYSDKWKDGYDLYKEKFGELK